MQLKFKKVCLLSTIIVYCASFLLQSNFVLFETWAKETNIPRVNIVAILVDNKIYDGISDNLKWYATNYVQNKLSDTKALVMPLDLTNIHAYDIYRMMENIYFDGLKDVNSSLIGLIMVGDVPLPVVNQDGYIFPTVYPYVDFVDQKYVWDDQSKYFVPNDHPEGQAEIRHGLINYGSDVQAYNRFFGKIKKYVQDPNNFIGDSIWYDDFVAQKEGFLSENLPYYRNKIMFAEDLGYQRFSPLMRNIFRGEQSENAINIVTELEKATNLNFSGKELLKEMSDGSAGEAHTTKVIQQEIQTSFVSDYNELFGSINMSTMRENIFAGGRWIKEAKDADGKKTLIADMDNSISKLQVKDDVLLGNENFQGLIENLNDLIEEMVDQKIADNKYDMDIVIPVSYENEGREKFRRFLRRRCISFPTRYDNYYFGLNARNVDSAKDLSIYRGTYRNLENLDLLTYNSLEKGYNPIVGEYDSTNPKLKSIGASFDIFSNQVEGNRGYQMFSVENDLAVYDEEKKNSVVQYKRVFKKKVNDKFWSDDCEKNDEDHICEDPFTFGLRWWGGASPMFLDTDSVSSGRYQLSGYKATDSWRSIFDMGGFQSLLPGDDEGMDGRGWVDGKGKGPQKAGATFRAYIKYSSPTERVGWEDAYGTKGTSMPFVRYVNNTPDVHGMSFSDMDYWKNKYVSEVSDISDDSVWLMSKESSNANIFTLAVNPRFYNNTCNRYPSGTGRTIRWQKYTYKVISSIVKHVSTTEDEINGVDRNRYGEGGILKGYYVNLKNSYINVNENVTDIVKNLKDLVKSAENANIIREINNLSGEIARIKTLDDAISDLYNRIKSAEDEEDGALVGDLQKQLYDKEKEKNNANADLGKALDNLLNAIKDDKNTLADVYSAITSLSADEIVSSLEMIAKDEKIDPEKFYNKEGNLTKVGFPQEWISEFVELESNVKGGINSILTLYSVAFASINEQKAKWDELKSELNDLELSEVNSDKIGAISDDMKDIFNISSLLAVDDSHANSNDPDEKGDTVLDGGTAEKIIKNGRNVSCPKTVTSEDDNTGNENEEDDTVGILVKFDGACGIIKMRQWLIEVDKLAPTIEQAAKADKDFRSWLVKNSISPANQADWINQYVKWTKGPGYDSEGAKKNHTLLQGASEHLSGMNLLTPDRPIDSPRYVSMQSIAGNEISFIYPDLFKVEVYTSKGKNKSGYDIHELLTVGEIKNNLIKYLNSKVYEYNKIIDKECNHAVNIDGDAHFGNLEKLGYYGAIPNKGMHGCNAKFTYKEFVDSLGGEKMLDIIAETLYYQSLTNTKKLSSENVEQDIELIKQSFSLNDKRGKILQDYLTLGNENVKNLVFQIPTYVSSGYEVGFINSDGRDYIFSENLDPENYSQTLVKNGSALYTNNVNSSANRQQETQQEKDLNDKCGIPPSGKLPLFQISGGSPWFVGFKCWLQNTLKSPVKVKLSFGGSLGEMLTSDSFKDYMSDSDIGQTFSDRGESVDQYGDAWSDLFGSSDEYDSDKVITQMQVSAEKHNQEIVGGIVYNIYKNIRVSNENVLLSMGNPTSEVKIQSVSDVGNITVEFLGTGDGCIKIDSHDLCNGEIFKTTFNPKEKPFVGIVSSSDNVAGKVALVIRIKVGREYIENVIKYTVSPGSLHHVDIKFGNDKTVVGMMTPVEIIGYDVNNNKISWGSEKYDFTVSQGSFLKDGAYQTGFSTNDFRNLKFYYKAPLDAIDGSVATIRMLYSGNVLGTGQQSIVRAYPVIKMAGETILQGKDILETGSVYNLGNDESIYVSGKLDPKRLKKIEVSMVDLKGKVVDLDSQISVKSQNGLVRIGQLGYQDGDNVFVETYNAYLKNGSAIIYYYPTTVAGDDIISIDIPGLDTRRIKLSVNPGEPGNVQLNLSNEYVSLNEKTDLKVFVSDVWGNPVSAIVKIKTDSRYVEVRGAEGYRDNDTVIYLVNVKDGTVQVPLYGVGGGIALVEAGFDNKEGKEILSDIEFRVDDALLPETGLNIMYLNYFGNDRGNQRGYLSDNNKRVENMMKNSNKIITTTTQLVSEDKIKRVLWKIDPGFRITDFDGVDTMLVFKEKKLYMSVGGLSEIEISVPSFGWVEDLSIKQISGKKNYLFFSPSEVDYSMKDGILYNSDGPLANIMDGEIVLQLTDELLDNGDNVWNVVYKGVNYGRLVMHLETLNPKVENFRSLGNRYVVGDLFINGSTDQMSSVGIFDSLSEFELNTSYKSIQNSDEVDERIGFLGDFKNITLFAEGQSVGEATKVYGSELLINLGDPVLSRKDLNEKVYGTNYNGGIGKEIYSDPEKDIFGVYQIDFNNDGLKDLLVAYQDGSFKLAKNYGGNPDLREMQEIMRIAVRIKNIFVGDADGNGYQDILVLTDNNQIRAYLNSGGMFDVDGSVVCLNQNVFEGEVSETPSNLEGLNQFFVEDMDLDGFVDIVTYDEKGYIKVFYGGSTSKGPNYLSTEKYACDAGWYEREAKNVKVVTVLGIQISGEDIFDNSMIRWVGMSKPEIEITSKDLPKYGVNFNPDNLINLVDTDDISGSISRLTRELMSNDKFDVGVASSQFIQEETKFQNVTLYENVLIGASGDSKNYIFAASSFLDPNNPEDKCSVWKNYSVKSGGKLLMNNDIVTVKVTIKASNKASCIGSYGDIIQGPWNVYYDQNGFMEGIRFLQNQKDAVVKSKDGNFSYLIDNIRLSPGEKMIFEYDLEYYQLPLKKMSITYKTFWSNDDLPDIKLQSSDGCEKNFDGFVNLGKRSFKSTLVPLQKLINDEYEDEDKNTRDYASETSSYIGDTNNIPGLVGDRIERVSLLKNDLKSAIFSENGINLNIDLSIFEEQMDDIANAIDDIAKGMCGGFSFGGSNNCKGLPVPFNQAFLAPGKYHLFGCREIPTGPLEKGLPIFFFPGTIYGPFGIPIPIPYGMVGATDEFIWAKGGVYPSLIRIYAAPTLTAQLGMAICMGPQNAMISLPSPISDLGGNCTVFAIKPSCGGGGDGGVGRKSDVNNPNEVYVEYTDDVKNSGVCLQTQKGSQVTKKGYRSSPFNMYTLDVRGGLNNQVEYETSFLGIVNLETAAHIGAADSDIPSLSSSLFIGDVNVLGGKYSVNKIRSAMQQGIRQMIIDKWLDPQIRYILNQLTKMHINIKLPDMSNLIDNEVQTMKNLSENLGKKDEDNSEAKGGTGKKSGFTKTSTGWGSKLGAWSYVNSDNLNKINESISNPFESLASLLNESNIINISVEPITVKIPMISAEDINGYEIYLYQWLDVNGKIVDRWKAVIDDLKSKDPERIQNQVEFDIGSDWQKLQNQIYVNLMTLQKYRNFPFEIYEWIHVIDRYIAEIISLIGNTIGYLSYWISTNSQRFVGYVDAIVLILNIIKTYQLLINFSVDRSSSCGSCTKDTYDQYSCKLSMLCSSINMPILQIPNFKLPNITLDFSNIDIGLDIILPSFNFQPIRVQLPELPNLPEPPSAAVNLNLKFPNIPMLPEPPELPELPSFIPEIELELPVLPPAPELPKLPSAIESIISIAKTIGKIYCIVKKGFGLVGESAVKAKIEQMTQRTYEVKWIDTIMDLTNLSFGPVHNYGLDYEISAQVDLQFEFSTFYDYLDALTKQINNLTTSSVNWVNNQANNFVNNNIVTGLGDAINGASFEFNAEGDLSMSDLSNVDIPGLESDDIEYVDYESAKSRLKEVLAYFVKETKDTTMGDGLKSSISSIENQINKENIIVSNTEGLEKVKNEAIDYLDREKLNYDSLAELINRDYDSFLVMVDSDEINKFALKTGQLLTYNVNLFNLDSSTKDVIKNMTKSNPYEAILSNKKTIIDGYWNAINGNTASDLGLSQAQYLVLRDSISSMRNQVTTLYSVTKPASLTNLVARNSFTSTDKTLLSAAGGGRLGSNMEVANVVDPSVLSEGIYGKIIEGSDKGKLAKIVYADSFASVIGDQYFHTKHTDVDDIILWNEGSVYLKCAGGVCNNGGGRYKGYYLSKVISQIPHEETRISFDKDTKLKISDGNIEIKNWNVDGQSYDDLRFSWRAEDVDAYLIKLVQRVDNSYEKSDYTSVVTPVIYVLAIPENVSLDDIYSGNVKLELVRKTDKVEKLFGKDLVQVVNYDADQDIIDIIISDIDRRWYYARIATLDFKDGTYNVTSPWSNQIVAGKQVLGDDLSPEGTPMLFRPTTNEVVSDGDYLDGYVGTKYKLTVNWEDNVALSYIGLLKDGKVLSEKYTSNSGDSVSTDIDIHTKVGRENFTTVGIDHFGNKTEKIISIDYSVPEINITDILRNSDGETVTIKAELSQDIDQGNVSFQRRRGEEWKTMTRKGVNLADFSVGPKQKLVVGSPYSVGNEVALYDKNGEAIALMNPFTAEITLQSGYKDSFEIKAVVQNGVILQIFNKKSNESVFSINVPTQKCVRYEATNYNVSQLPEEGKMGMFNGGVAIYKDGSNVLFMSPSCHLYSDLSTSLEGTYDYDRELDAVVLTLYQGSDLEKSSPIKVWFKVKPLIED